MSFPKPLKLPPLENHQDFERLCADLINARERPVVPARPYGRSGQAQHGLDLALESRHGLVGYQFKAGELTKALLDKELANTATFPSREALKRFTVMTGSFSDARLQDHVFCLNRERVQNGLFPVDVVFWNEIRDWLLEFPDLVEKFYRFRPTLDDTIRAASRRLEREHPGAKLSVEASGGEVSMCVTPGPAGFVVNARLDENAQRKLEQVQKSGLPQLFSNSELCLTLPSAIRSLHPGAEPVGVVVSPSRNGVSVPVRFVVEPKSSVHTPEMFARRALKGRYQGRSASLTIVRDGTEHHASRIDLLGLPLTVDLELDAQGATATIRRHYAGRFVEEALAGERFVSSFPSSYAGVFAQDVDVAGVRSSISFHWSGEISGAESVDALIQLLEDAVHLGELSGWDIRVPDRWEAEDIWKVQSLLSLFQFGKRSLPLDTTFRLDGAEVGLPAEALPEYFARSVPPYSFSVRCARQERLFGCLHQMPLTSTRLVDVVAEDVLCGSDGEQVSLEIRVHPTGSIEETICDPGGPSERE